MSAKKSQVNNIWIGIVTAAFLQKLLIHSVLEYKIIYCEDNRPVWIYPIYETEIIDWETLEWTRPKIKEINIEMIRYVLGPQSILMGFNRRYRLLIWRDWSWQNETIS